MADDDLDQADAVAFVLAHLRHDEAAIEAMLAMHTVRDLFAATTGLLVDRLMADSYPGGLAGLQRTLEGWQQQRNVMFGRWA